MKILLKRKAITMMSVKMISLIILISLLIVAFIFSQNLKSQTLKDRQEILDYEYTINSINNFFKSPLCMNSNHLSNNKEMSGLALIDKSKLDYFNNSYKNIQLPCFKNTNDNYEITVQTRDISYRIIPEVIDVGTYVLIIDYSTSLLYPLKDNSKYTKLDILINSTKDLIAQIDNILNEVHNDPRYGFVDTSLKFKVLFFNGKDTFIVYPLDEFNKSKIIENINSFLNTMKPSSGTPLFDTLDSEILQKKDNKYITNATYVLISDMCSEGDEHSINDVISDLELTNSKIFALSSGSSLTQPFSLEEQVPKENVSCTYYYFPAEDQIKLPYSTHMAYSQISGWRQTSFGCNYNLNDMDSLINSCDNSLLSHKGDYELYYCFEITDKGWGLNYYSIATYTKDFTSVCSDIGNQLTSINNGYYVYSNDPDEISNMFNDILDKIKESIYDAMEKGIKLKSTNYKGQYWHIGVYKNTPEYFGGKETVISMPVVLLDNNGPDLLAYMTFKVHKGELERLYSLIQTLCNSEKNIIIRKEFTFPEKVNILQNQVCMLNICKSLKCKYNINTLTIPKGNSIMEFNKRNSLQINLVN